MHPLLNQQLAKQHMKDIQREARTVHGAILTNRAGEIDHHYGLLSFLQYLYDRTRILYGRPVVLSASGEVRLEEIKPAVLTTFSTMHEIGLVSEYDDQFVEKFIETLERELVHQSHC